MAPRKDEKEPRKYEALFEKRPRNYGIGQSIQPKRDLSRYVRWPKYVRLQRQRKVLLQRLKVPPAINQFTKTADKNLASSLLQMLSKYRPEDKQQKRKRLMQRAEAEAAGAGTATPATPKPLFIKHGVNHVTEMIEQKRAKLVLIAHDVDPIELVLWMPALCRKMDVPYVIIRGKARLGQLVHRKTATCVAVTQVADRDRADFTKLVEACRARFNDRYEEVRKQWGGGILGLKSQHKVEKKRQALLAEEMKRAQA